jgi:hypothetical protein
LLPFHPLLPTPSPLSSFAQKEPPLYNCRRAARLQHFILESSTVGSTVFVRLLKTKQNLPKKKIIMAFKAMLVFALLFALVFAGERSNFVNE